MDYPCTFSVDQISFEGSASIGDEKLLLRAKGYTKEIDYAFIYDMRLINYHMFIVVDPVVANSDLEISKLGRNTEDFFENLWSAYDERSRQSLFVPAKAEYEAEGDYEYIEPELSKKSKAHIGLYKDCICIVPHDKNARRVPLCFAQKPMVDGYQLHLKLDTGEYYSIGRMGRDSLVYFERLGKYHADACAKWKQSHEELERNLETRLGDRKAQYEIIREVSDLIITGLFSPEDDAFWFAGIKAGKAVVELVIPENAATYLYEFTSSMDVDDFISCIRHAMEAVGTNREVIFGDLEGKTLYKMSVDRSVYVRILRKLNVGRIIHNQAWEKNIRNII
ncbi:MAG: hypothetical protein MJ086_00595 [Lachnospiraceae bacterium]|nr:hypothetical protein [Lachnospiraceae bacterium]